VFFGFDADQLVPRDALAGLLGKRAGLTLLNEAWVDPLGSEVWSVWEDLAGLGVQGLMAPETAGGSAFDWVTMTLVLTETGRVALPLPVLETAAIGVPLLAASQGPTGLLPSLIDGSAVLTAGQPGALIPYVSKADWFLIGETLYSRPEVTIEPVLSVDRTRDTGRVVPTGPGVALSGAPSLSLVGALASAAVLVGLGRALVQITVDYVKDRKQFGVPIGSFQAVKHHLADAAMGVEFAAPAVWAAAWEMDHTGADLSRSVSLAKALASDAAGKAARAALQCHGAMGYTDDYHLHFWLKRVWCLAPAYGTAREHRIRIGRQLALLPPGEGDRLSPFGGGPRVETPGCRTRPRWW
jgi:alkylation response protein AidB-like acyl-CoA dehydrogenase